MYQKDFFPCCCGSLFIFLSFLSVSLSNICDFDVKVTQVLQNEGFHRKLDYNVIVMNEKEEFLDSFRGCIIGVNQRLPQGLYANPDEIEDLRRSNQINVTMKRNVNVEESTDLAKPMSFFLKEFVYDKETFLSIPLHARYHKAVAGGGIARNEIPAPRLYVKCNDDRFKNCQPVTENTKTVSRPNDEVQEIKWTKISFTLMTKTLHWNVPVGNTDHFYAVSIVTALVLILGSFFILESIHEFKIDGKKKKR